MYDVAINRIYQCRSKEEERDCHDDPVDSASQIDHEHESERRITARMDAFRMTFCNCKVRR